MNRRQLACLVLVAVAVNAVAAWSLLPSTAQRPAPPADTAAVQAAPHMEYAHD